MRLDLSPEIRGKILRTTGAALATLVTTAATFEATAPKIPYETSPHEIKDDTLWRFLRWPFGGVMGLCGADGKESNWWQWKELGPVPPDLKPVGVLPGDPENFPRRNKWDSLLMSCGGWEKVFLLRPQDKDGNDDWNTIWRVGYSILGPNGKYNQFSGNLKGPITLMQGDVDIKVFATNLDGKQIYHFKIDDKTYDRHERPAPSI